MTNNNNIFLTGQINNIEFFYEYKGSRFFKAFLEVKRNSPKLDIIPIVFNEFFILNEKISNEDFITLDGEVRTNNHDTKNSHDDEKIKSKLFIYCFAKDVKKILRKESEIIVERNIAILDGYVCRDPYLRTTSKGKLLCSTILANNRHWYKTNYIPIIAWGKEATLMSECKIGEFVKLSGLFHSREYNLVEKKIAYEISSILFSKQDIR